MYQKNKTIRGDIVILTNIIKDALEQEKLEDFKLYLEEYFLDNGITKNMFVNVVYDNLQQYQITPQTIS